MVCLTLVCSGEVLCVGEVDWRWVSDCDILLTGPEDSSVAEVSLLTVLPALIFPGLGFMMDLVVSECSQFLPGGRMGTLLGESILPPGPGFRSPGGLLTRCGDDSRLLLAASKFSRLLALFNPPPFLSTRMGLDMWTLSLASLCFGCDWEVGWGNFFCLPWTGEGSCCLDCLDCFCSCFC